MLLDPFYGVYGTSTKIAHILNRILILAEYGAFGYVIYRVAREGGLGVGGWIMLCVAGVAAIQVLNLVLRFLWGVCLTFVYGTTDADEIVEAHDRKLHERHIRQEERRCRLEDARLNREREVIEKEWNEQHEPTFEDADVQL